MASCVNSSPFGGRSWPIHWFGAFIHSWIKCGHLFNFTPPPRLRKPPSRHSRTPPGMSSLCELLVPVVSVSTSGGLSVPFHCTQRSLQRCRQWSCKEPVFGKSLQELRVPGGPFDREKGGQGRLAKWLRKNGWPWNQDMAVKTRFGPEKVCIWPWKNVEWPWKPWKTWNCRRQCEWPWKQRMAVKIFFVDESGLCAFFVIKWLPRFTQCPSALRCDCHKLDQVLNAVSVVKTTDEITKIFLWTFNVWANTDDQPVTKIFLKLTDQLKVLTRHPLHCPRSFRPWSVQNLMVVQGQHQPPTDPQIRTNCHRALKISSGSFCQPSVDPSIIKTRIRQENLRPKRLWLCCNLFDFNWLRENNRFRLCLLWPQNRCTVWWTLCKKRRWLLWSRRFRCWKICCTICCNPNRNRPNTQWCGLCCTPNWNRPNIKWCGLWWLRPRNGCWRRRRTLLSTSARRRPAIGSFGTSFGFFGGGGNGGSFGPDADPQAAFAATLTGSCDSGFSSASSALSDEISQASSWTPITPGRSVALCPSKIEWSRI